MCGSDGTRTSASTNGNVKLQCVSVGVWCGEMCAGVICYKDIIALDYWAEEWCG
jgi:hypothetical protein